MSLIKSTVLNGIATLIKVASALALNKILAVYVGPAGFAIIGQLQSVMNIASGLAGGVIAQGVTKLTAEHYEDPATQYAVWATALKCGLIAALVIALFLTFLSTYLAHLLFSQTGLSTVLIWGALALPAITANNIFLSIINGKKELFLYVVSNILGSLISLITIGLLAHSFGLYGALVAVCVSPALFLFATVILMSKRHWVKKAYLWGPIQRTQVTNLFHFVMMGLTSTLCVPLTHILIRYYQISHLGKDAAGYWQAVLKISETYLMVITVTLSVYYLPRLAEISRKDEIIHEIRKVYALVIPLVICAAFTVYFLRNFIILTLFTSEFMPMRELFSWQLVGDILKIGSWVLSFVMVGRGMTKTFIISELFFSATFLLMALVFTNWYGNVGASIAYTSNNLIYWITMFFIVRAEVCSMPNNNS